MLRVAARVVSVETTINTLHGVCEVLQFALYEAGLLLSLPEFTQEDF
jgi:hypothetical protein